MNAERQNKILILGGYGGNNVGDDAQLAQSLEDLRLAINDAVLIVLTPDLVQTIHRHGVESVGYAPRVSFFDFDIDRWRYIRFRTLENAEWLIARAEAIYKEAIAFSKNMGGGLTKSGWL